MDNNWRTPIGQSLTSLMLICKEIDHFECKSIDLGHVEPFYNQVVDEGGISHYAQNMEILKSLNASCKTRESSYDEDEKEFEIYMYMGYVVRAAMARYKLEYEHSHAARTNSVAILENFHGRLVNLESHLPASHQSRGLP
jgi:hypothetical protein